MSKTVDQKREMKAQKFIVNAKEEFKKLIPRDKIDSVGVTECVEKDGDFEITGMVGTVSPTGKEKTFGYTAKVNVDANEVCSLVKLQVRDL